MLNWVPLQQEVPNSCFAVSLKCVPLSRLFENLAWHSVVCLEQVQCSFRQFGGGSMFDYKWIIRQLLIYAFYASLKGRSNDVVIMIGYGRDGCV